MGARRGFSGFQWFPRKGRGPRSLSPARSNSKGTRTPRKRRNNPVKSTIFEHSLAIAPFSPFRLSVAPGEPKTLPSRLTGRWFTDTLEGKPFRGFLFAKEKAAFQPVSHLFDLKNYRLLN